MKTKNITLISQNKDVLNVAFITALILAIPIAAMQLTNEVVWGVFDFIIAGILIFGTGFIYTMTARKIKSTQTRMVIGAVLLVVFFAIWAELAVDAVSQAVSFFRL